MPVQPGSVVGAWTRRSIQTRIVLLVAVGIVAPLAVLGWASWTIVRDLGDRWLRERERLAQSLAEHIEQVVGSDLELLQAVSAAPGFDLRDEDPVPERESIRRAYLHARVFERILLLDERRTLRWQEPGGSSADDMGSADPRAVEWAFQAARPVASSLSDLSSGAQRLHVFLPLRDWQGRVVGLAAGEVRGGSSRVISLLRPFRPGSHGTIDLLDGEGKTMASAGTASALAAADDRDMARRLVREARSRVWTVRRDGVDETLAFAPLSAVPWGILIRQRGDEATPPTRTLGRTILQLGPLLLAMAILFALGTARSVRRPLAVLTRAAERITAGQMDLVIPPLGTDEIGRLGRALEAMRAALKESLDRIARANQELEGRVTERTRELERIHEQLKEREQWRGQLLRKVISAQEDERKRIARELHDETSQTLTALVVGLEATAAGLPSGAAREHLVEVKALAVRTLDELHRLIFDLRPSVLDDLGLQPAIRWYAERHLAPLGVSVRCEFTGPDRRLPPQVETAVFRMVQEAITNIARHARAETVLIQCLIRGEWLIVEIEDDGTGFEPGRYGRPVDSDQGLGLLGMRERVELLGGTVQIQSAPGKGTRIALEVPVPVEVTDV